MKALLFLWPVLMVLASTSTAATFTVSNTNQIGPGSLRQAIDDANSSPGGDVIQFSIGGGSGLTISPTNALPSITDPVTIDGTQGVPGLPVVELNGQFAGSGADGFRIFTSNCIIRSIVINRFNGNGVLISSNGGNRVLDCVIGLDVARTTARANTLNGVYITNSAANYIAGSMISGNLQSGLHIGGAASISNQVVANVIGLDANNADKGNGTDGIRLNAPFNVIGNWDSLGGNVIAGNNSDGIEVAGAGSTNNLILGNTIGTDLAMALARGNGSDGIFLNGAPANSVSNNTVVANNTGIEVAGTSAAFNTIYGNFIGTRPAAAPGLGNTANGISITSNARSNFIGGVSFNAGNMIAYNAGDGVNAATGTNNAVRGNRVFSNGDLGIDLGNNGVTINDAGDTDTGANNLQNYPLLTGATNQSSSVAIAGTLNSRPATTYAVDLFANTAPEATGFGEGQQFLGSTNVTTDGSGNAVFVVTISASIAGRYVTATATDPAGNTSEFSPSIAAASTVGPQTYVVTNNNDSGPGSLRQAILGANAFVGNGADTISFNIAGSGPQTNRPSSALPPITDSVIIDGFTQPGSSANTLLTSNNGVWRIVLDGTSAGSGADGLIVQASNCVIRGLCVTRFPGDGIEISTNGNSRVEGCLIGIGPDGTRQQNNGNGIFLNASPNNDIGGGAPSSRNVISGNGGNGIAISGTNAYANRILNNFIGTGTAGTNRIQNNGDGVNISGAPRTVIGDPAQNAINLISGNSGDGVELNGAATTDTLIFGNRIGTDYLGGLALANTQIGINAQNNARSNSIGDTALGRGNWIAFNGNIGVGIGSGTNNVIRGNLIYSNANLGIDLGNNGKTSNDAGDGDSGANQLQNHPILTNAILGAATTRIDGTLNSRPGTAYIIDFYANSFGDNSGNGEGQIYLGATNVTTGVDSNAAYSVILAVVPNARFITATATDPAGNTSEFGPNVQASSQIAPSTFVVVNTANNGAGSLREALESANGIPVDSPHRITFAIPGAGPHVIAPTAALPPLFEPMVVDGYTQPGASTNTASQGNNAVIKIRVDGANAGASVDGLRLGASIGGTQIRGLSITRFAGDGIQIDTNGHCRIEGCFLGIDTDGASTLGNSGHGINIASAPENAIGGESAGQRNVISGNGQHGISISGVGSISNAVSGNFIGTDAAGALGRANGNDGVNLNNAPANLIGSGNPGGGNVISGNNSQGVNINGAGSSNNVVLGNWIGTDRASAAPLGNGQNGVQVTTSARLAIIGRTNNGADNVIAFNGAAGINVSSGSNNVARGNRIFSNGGLGIDLGGNGITANDTNDADNGPNLQQNFPVLAAALITTTNTSISGSLQSSSNSSYVVDFYASTAADPSGNGEGQQYLGSTTISTDTGGNRSFNVVLSTVSTGRYLTATATDTNGNTSEYSASVPAVSAQPPRTFTVLNTNDSGPGSLRQALLDAGNYPAAAPHLIQFNINGAGPHTIAPLTMLPTNREPVVIDGYTQPGATTNALTNGFTAAIRIRLDGTSVTGFGIAGLRLQTGGNTVRGIAFTHWNNMTAIEISSGGSNRIAGCLVGIDLDGSDQRASTGIFINNSAGNEIGGLTPGDRNVISYNFGHAVQIVGAGASNNAVRGNFIGTDLTGTLKRSNFGSGVVIDGASQNIVGGTAPGARNVIAGNFRGVEIAISSGPSTGNMIQGNLIGTDVTGTLTLGNSQNGVSVLGADTIIGGSAPLARNVISGNGQFGIDLGPSAIGSTVQGNWIGIGLSSGAVSNGASGIAISGNSNHIGGALAGQGNVVAYNRGPGVYVASGTQNEIRRNSIFANHSVFSFGLGIDLGGDGVTANDAGDADTGPNNQQNFPAITFASGNASSITIRGTLNSLPSKTYALDFFANDACDSSGNGEGEIYLGSGTAATDGAGNGSFDVTLAGAAGGRFITATATDPDGNSSEFSPCFEGTIAIAPATFTVVNTNDAGPGSLRQAIADSNDHVTSSNNIIAFNIGGAGVRPIKLLSPLPSFTQPATIDGFTQPGASANTLPNGNNATWLIELRGIGATLFNEEVLRLNIPNMVARGLRITASAGDGIAMASSNCVVAGCFIYSNFAGGIAMTSANGNRIGGTGAGDRNIISGHGGSRGIEVNGGNNNLVLGNYIGPDPAGGNSLGGQFEGISLFNSSGNQIGNGTISGGNVIAYHTSAGVLIQSGTNNVVRANRLLSNSFPLDLGSDRATPNDAGDGDEGANHAQNYPVLTNVVANATSTVAQGRLNSRPNTTYTLDVYASTTCSAGYGEGENYLGSGSITTDASGNVNFSVSAPTPISGRQITATATDPDGNTSEFSACAEPGTVTIPGQTYVVTTTNDSGPGSFRQALTDAMRLPNSGPDRIEFNIPGSGARTIQLTSDLPGLGEPIIIDGYTQPGTSQNTSSNGNNAILLIELDNQLAPGPNRLLSIGSNSTVRGLSFRAITGTLLVLNGSSNVVEGNWFGLRPTLATGAGLAIQKTGRVKTDFPPPGNGGAAGIVAFGSGNVIGGESLPQRNIIGNSSSYGIRLPTGNNVLQGNLIGIGPDGLHPAPNGGGVEIRSGGNLIGGITPLAGNIIAGNTGAGIDLFSGSGNVIQGNLIGTDRTGITQLPNGGDGIRILGASLNTIGGDTEGTGNLIGFHRGHGIFIGSGNQNTVRNNLIGYNEGGDIQLQPGANGGVGTPILEQASQGNSPTVRGRFSGIPNTLYQVDAFVRIQPPFAPPSVASIIRLGTFNVTTDPGGQASFTHTFSGTYPHYSATYLQIHCEANSSAHSTAVPLVPGNSADLKIAMSPPGNVLQLSNFTVSVYVTNTGPATASNVAVTVGIPAAFTAGSVSNANCSVSNGRLRCVIGDMPPGTVTRVDLNLTANSPGLAVMSGQATSATPDSSPDDNIINRETYVAKQAGQFANLEVTFPDKGTTPMSALNGFPMSLRVRVRNLGPSVAENVKLRVILRPSPHFSNHLAVLSNPGSGGGVSSDNPNVAAFTVATLASGSMFEVTLNALWVANRGDATAVAKVLASVKSETLDFASRNNVADAKVSVGGTGMQNEIRSGGLVYNATWPTTAFPGTLEHSSNLETWQNWTGPIVVENGRFGISVPISGTPTQDFFRVRYPPETLPNISVDQLSVDVNGLWIENSEWGTVTLRSPANSEAQFFNLNFKNNWVVQNVPFIPVDDPQKPAETTFSFPISPSGVETLNGTYGFSVTPAPIVIMPPTIGTISVFPNLSALDPGEANKPVIYLPPDILAGSAPLQIAFNQPVFPNPDQGPNECAVMAMANSLSYLNALNNLGMDPAKISLDKMKEVVEWQAGGAPVGEDPTHPLWAQRKGAYLTAEGLPITTEMTQDPARVMEALGKSCDVEIRVTGHAACLRGLFPLGGTRYMMLVSHDLDQHREGGTVLEPIFLDTSNGDMTGGIWTHGRKLTAFVIECVKE